MAPPVKSTAAKKAASASARESNLKSDVSDERMSAQNYDTPDVPDDDDERLEPESPEQDELIRAGARPVQFDQSALERQIAAMQAQIDQLKAQQPTPGDPVEAGLLNLALHVQARVSASPNLIGAKELQKAIQEGRDSDGLTSDDSEFLQLTVTEFVESNPGKELEYLRVLSRDLHKAVLKPDDKNKDKR